MTFIVRATIRREGGKAAVPCRFCYRNDKFATVLLHGGHALRRSPCMPLSFCAAVINMLRTCR